MISPSICHHLPSRTLGLSVLCGWNGQWPFWAKEKSCTVFKTVKIDLWVLELVVGLSDHFQSIFWPILLQGSSNQSPQHAVNPTKSAPKNPFLPLCQFCQVFQFCQFYSRIDWRLEKLSEDVPQTIFNRRTICKANFLDLDLVNALKTWLKLKRRKTPCFFREKRHSLCR